MQMKFRLIASAAALVMLAGCSFSETIENVQGDIFEKTKFDDDTNYTEIQPLNSIDSENYTSNGVIRYGYDSLYTDSQRTCYDLIGTAAYKISEIPGEDGFYAVGKVKIEDKSFTDRDMDLSIKAFTMDHPEVFWLTNRYTYGTAGNQSVIQLYSYVSGAECSKRISSLNNSINDIISGIPSDLNEYHLEKYIHNTLLAGCTYAKGVELAEDGWEEFTVYGALVNGSAVCEGYAHAMCLLLNKVGIDCYYVNGYGENAPHMWNVVNIGGDWYHLDATWDDNENAYFNYFNLSDDKVKEDHIIEASVDKLKNEDTLPEIYNLFLPECSSESQNYFVIESTYIEDFSDSRDVMVSDLIEAAQNGDDMFTIRLNSAYNYEDAINVMFHEEPYYMFDYIEEANEQLDESHRMNNENLAIIMIANFNAIVVKLEYD